jgi:hypothetical protein
MRVSISVPTLTQEELDMLKPTGELLEQVLTVLLIGKLRRKRKRQRGECGLKGTKMLVRGSGGK